MYLYLFRYNYNTPSVPITVLREGSSLRNPQSNCCNALYFAEAPSSEWYSLRPYFFLFQIEATGLLYKSNVELFS